MERTDEKLFSVINQSFRELAHCIGGIAVTRNLDDLTIEYMADGIANIYFRTIGRMEDILKSGVVFNRGGSDSHPHPDIEQLLKLINFTPPCKKEGA